MPADLTPDTFRPHVGTTFTVEVEGGEPVVLTLEEVELRGEGHEQRTQPFSLLFSGPTDRTVAQATVRLAHPGLGDLDIFLVPIEPGRYEALFN